MVFPSSSSHIIPLRSRDSFFRDPYFSDCWEIMERRKKEFEQKCSNGATSSDLGTSSRSSNDYFSSTNGNSSKLIDSSYADPLTSSARSRARRLNHFYNYYPTTALMRDNMDHLFDEDFIGRNRSGLLSSSSSGLGIQMDKETFKISLDVQQFSPEELTVKTIHNTILIEGKHEEKQDTHGFISRNFQRKYTLPSDVKPEEVNCSFTSDGLLQISAPRHLDQQQQASTATNTTTTSSSSTNQMSLAEKIKHDMRQAREDWDKSTSEMFKREPKDHSRLLRMFEPHFAAFPEFDPVPFWKRESPRTCSLIEELSSKDKQSSLLVDEFGCKRTTTQLLEEINKRKAELLKDSKSGSNASELQCDRDNFKVMLDVQQFKPEEINVKTYDYFVVVEAKHEAKEDPHGTITREFKRKYMLPRDVRSQDVICNLSSDGVLVIMAPRIKPEELEVASHGKHVPIQHTETATSTAATSSSVKSNESSSQTKKSSAEHLIHIDNEQAATSATAATTTTQNQTEVQAPATKSFQNTTTFHEIRTERTPVAPTTNGVSTNEKTITVDKEQQSSNVNIDNAASTASGTRTETGATRPFSYANSSEHVIPITREISLISNGPGVRVDFPESRPESAASTATSTIGNSTTIPFDFTHSERERQGSVGGAPDLPQDPPTVTDPPATTAPGERIIKISIGA